VNIPINKFDVIKIIIIIIFLFFITVNIYGQENKLNWLTDFDEATYASCELEKPILMYFTGSDWCAPCKKLKEDFFNTEEFKIEAKKFVLLMIDLPRRNGIISPEQKRKNMILMQDYNRRNSFPSMIGLCAYGKTLGSINGYNRANGTGDYFDFLKKISQEY